MSSAPTSEEIWKDARWLVQAVDPRSELIRLVEMTPEDYRNASFLDDRMFGQQRIVHLLPWADVARSAPAKVRTDARWIFHIGHVGSTLLARLLGELDDVLSIREPRALRDLTFFPADVRARFIPTLQALVSRSFDGEQLALLKATSFVSEIAPELVPRGERALFLYAKPSNYVAGILAGENSRKELAALAGARAQRLSSRGIGLPQPRSESHLAAAAWACEMTALETAAAKIANVHWADFDTVLADLPKQLQVTAAFFGFGGSPKRLAEIAASPLTRRYSKATEYEYSPQLRRDLLAEAYGMHRSDIESALAMLAAASETAPLLRKALERAQAES
jgi:hypothetical protein